MKPKKQYHEPAKWRMPLRWQNFTLMGVAALLIIAGFVLMLPPEDVRSAPGGRHAAAPGPGAFDARRVRLAPAICLAGFVLMLPAIVYVPDEKGGVR